MELGMVEWEGEMGGWRGDTGMATYPSDPFMTPCASISRLTAITTTTLEGPYGETVAARAVLATLRVARSESAERPPTCLTRSHGL